MKRRHKEGQLHTCGLRSHSYFSYFLSLLLYEAHLEQFLRQIATFIDATVHRDESLNSGLVPDIGVMQAGIEHNDGE